MKHPAALLVFVMAGFLGSALIGLPLAKSQSTTDAPATQPADQPPAKQEPASRPARQPSHLEMSVIFVSDARPIEYLLLVGNSVAFRRVESLKRFIADLPAGSSLTWAPGCLRTGDEPLLNSQQDMDDFKKHCEKHQVKLIIIPSG